MKFAYSHCFGGVLLCLGLTGCNMVKDNHPAAPPPPSYDQLMSQAEGRVQAQDVGGAKSLFAKAASADPTRKEPWYRLAQLDFNQQSYGRAIVDSEEVLQRDPADVDAESILTVAGLRIAVAALGRLHDESDLQGPAHSEAEKLAAKMRETLGQDVLVPPHKRVVRHHHRASKHSEKSANGSAPAVPPKTTQAASSNPFQALPGGS